MLNLITVMGTRTVAKQLTKPMKILNIIKNLLTIVGLLFITSMGLFIAYLEKPMVEVISVSAFCGLIGFIGIPTIQLIIKHFTTMDNVLSEKQSKKFNKKLAKLDYKLVQKSNEKVTKNIAKNGDKIKAKEFAKRAKYQAKQEKIAIKKSKKNK